ncbi:hypothetical protein [uncultured Aquimarina sp.]|uniref:hypothetical protein n=1 Tax=uncultured Aquimarina sp. TaxID=575652 RepID=UPI002609E376|nr:hypothetical protein [uncultured Aquimarina sp.]
MEVNESKTVYLKVGEDISKNKNSDFSLPYHLTVGRIAESLIQELFLFEGYQTYKNGLENTYQYLYKQIKKNKTEVAKSIRKSPDLILYDPCKEKLYYAEIKFCSTSYFKWKDNDFENYEVRFPNGYFFIVTPANIYTISIKELREIKILYFDKNPNFLIGNSSFNLREYSLERFREFQRVLFNDEFLKQHKEIRKSF